jgi:hypothetical protein
MANKQAVSQRLHSDMHKLPGVPAHDEATTKNANAWAKRAHSRTHATPHPSLTNPTTHHNQPKVLVSLQQRIGRLFGRDGD